MSGESDQVKGRAKEAAGVLTGNEDLEAEGKIDRRAGEVEGKIDQAKDQIGEMIDKAKGKVGEAVDKVKDAVDRK